MSNQRFELEDFKNQIHTDLFGNQYLRVKSLHNLLWENLYDNVEISGHLECGEDCGKCDLQSQKYLRQNCDDLRIGEDFLDDWNLITEGDISTVIDLVSGLNEWVFIEGIPELNFLPKTLC